jgi:hypothetical protein
MVGGAISGYCEIGSTARAASPNRTMTIEITQAKTGRSMNTRANISPLRGSSE